MSRLHNTVLRKAVLRTLYSAVHVQHVKPYLSHHPGCEGVKHSLCALVVRVELESSEHVVLREVEGMTQINETAPLKIVATGKHDFTVELDSTGFNDYTRQGVVEDQKVPKKVEFKSWAECFPNPA